MKGKQTEQTERTLRLRPLPNCNSGGDAGGGGTTQVGLNADLEWGP